MARMCIGNRKDFRRIELIKRAFIFGLSVVLIGGWFDALRAENQAPTSAKPKATAPKAVHDPVKAQPPAPSAQKPKVAVKSQKPKELSPLAKQMNALKSEKLDDRRQAVEELSQLKDPHATPALIVALSDRDSLVRAGAARALGLMRAPDAVKELGRVVMDDPDPQVTQSAAMALGFISDPAAVDPLVQALKKGAPGTRLSACQALANLKSPAAIPALRETLQDPSPQMKRMVLQTLGEIGDPAAIPDIRPVLRDKDFSLQVAAVLSLGKLQDKDKGTVSTFKKYLDKKNPTELRVAAAQALASLGDNQGKNVALDVLGDKTVEARVRVMAAQALGDMADPSLAPALKKISEQEEPGFVKQYTDSLLQRITVNKQ